MAKDSKNWESPLEKTLKQREEIERRIYDPLDSLKDFQEKINKPYRDLQTTIKEIKAPLNKSKSSTIRLSLPLSLQGFQRLIRAPRRLIQRCLNQPYKDLQTAIKKMAIIPSPQVRLKAVSWPLSTRETLEPPLCPSPSFLKSLAVTGESEFYGDLI